jgi:hypothetical protein
MKRYTILAVAFLAIAGLIGFVVRLPADGGGGGGANLANATPAPAAKGPAHSVNGGGTFSGSDTVATTTMTGGGGTLPVAVGAPSVTGPTTGGIGGGGGGGSSSGGTFIGSTSSVGGVREISASELVGPRVVKTAQLSLVAKRGDFANAFDRATQVAQLYHGFVESSATSGVKSKFGRLTIRVPADLFDQALHDLRGLGRVDGQSISGQDVTSQYVDMQARLRNWQAQEKVLLKLMSRATTIGETLRVQNELSQVQMRIEELKGQLRVLNNQTSFSTIDVAMREAGTPVHTRQQKKHEQSTIAQAWDDARHGFVGVLAAIVVGLGYLIPITALLALIWLGLRRLRPRVAAS